MYNVDLLQQAMKPASSLQGNLRRLLLLRVILLMGGVFAAAFASYRLHVHLDLLPIVLICIALAWMTAQSWRRVSARGRVSNWTLLLELAMDVVALTAILAFAGGAANPFTLLYLIPVTMAAATFARATFTWAVVALAGAAYTALLLWSTPGAGQHQDAGLHATGMWLGFTVSSCLVAYFAVSMQRLSRQRDRILAEAREKALRDQQLVELGTLAASAAHDLGTPLATISVIAGELEGEFANDDVIAPRARLLREQVKRCKKSLSVLSAKAGQLQADAGAPRRVDEYLKTLAADWAAVRPEVTLRTDFRGSQPSPRILADRTLTYAVINLLNNAADVSPQDVELSAQWSDQELEVNICDRGPGFDPALLPAAGKMLFTTKDGDAGLGIGVFLSYATISRLGGSVQVVRRPEGGTQTQVVLPLQSLDVSRGEKNNDDTYDITVAETLPVVSAGG